MRPQWHQHLKRKEDKDAFEARVLDADIVLKRLADIIRADLESTDRVVAADYDSPSWSHKQAHHNGENAALRRILALLNIDVK